LAFSGEEEALTFVALGGIREIQTGYALSILPVIPNIAITSLDFVVESTSRVGNG
jgi:hypothetical protein